MKYYDCLSSSTCPNCSITTSYVPSDLSPTVPLNLPAVSPQPDLSASFDVGSTSGSPLIAPPSVAMTNTIACACSTALSSCLVSSASRSSFSFFCFSSSVLRLYPAPVGSLSAACCTLASFSKVASSFLTLNPSDLLLAMGRYGPYVTYTVLRMATINAPPPMGPLGELMGDPGASFSKYPRGGTISKGCQP